MISAFFGISIRASRLFRVLSKLGGMTLYGTLKVVLKPPTKVHYGVKNPKMARKEDVFTVDVFLR